MNAPITSYKLNPANAKQVGTSASITEKGKYYGVFTRAEHVQSKKGTQGIEFDFKSNDGAAAKYLTIWTVNGQGKELFGRKVIDAIMTSMGVKDITATEGMVKKYDFESKADVTVKAIVFQQLMDKPVGVVLAREEYLPSTGNGTKWKNMLVCPFEASTDRIAIERLENKAAETLPKILATLTDRPLRSGGGHAAAPSGDTGSGFDDMPDDIPF